MAAAAFPQDNLLPQPTGGLAPGAAAALLVHAGLIAALTISIDWRSRQPEVVAAELWAAVPQTAAPAPPPPVAVAPAPAPAPPAPTPPAPPVVKPPPQPDPDIALERERRLKAEKQKADDDLKKAEADRKRKADEKKAEEKKEADRKKQEAAEAARVAAEKAEEKADDERREKQRQENLRRMMGQAGTTPTTSGSTGTAAQNAAPSANYLSRLRKLVRDQVVFNGTVPGNAAAEVAVTTAPGGTIISSRLIKSSGHKEWDEAVIRALEKLGSLPRDTDGRVPPSLTLVFRQTD